MEATRKDTLRLGSKPPTTSEMRGAFNRDSTVVPHQSVGHGGGDGGKAEDDHAVGRQNSIRANHARRLEPARRFTSQLSVPPQCGRLVLAALDDAAVGRALRLMLHGTETRLVPSQLWVPQVDDQHEPRRVRVIAHLVLK